MKKIKTIKCIHCEENFIPDHGNNTYCPKKNCQYEAKKDRQKDQYLIGHDAKCAIQKNHKLFTQLLKEEKLGEFDLFEVEKMGFIADGYYQRLAQKDKILYQCHTYYFSITNTTPKKVQIWKI